MGPIGCREMSVTLAISVAQYPEERIPQEGTGVVKVSYRLYRCLLSVFVVVGLFGTAAMKAYCTLTPHNEFRHSSPEALHTKRRERPLLAKYGTKVKEFS
jgi:hypothetical protein